MVLLLTREFTKLMAELLHTTFQVAEQVLATLERRNMRSRERHLLDVFAEHITAEAKAGSVGESKPRARRRFKLDRR